MPGGSTVIDIDELRADLLGRALPAGAFRVPPHEAWLTADALGSPPLPDGVLHPMYVWYASMRGVGYTIEELFELVGSTAADGPMLGETDITHLRALRVGEELRVSATIADLVRKQGRSGTFDLLRLSIEVRDGDDLLVGTVVNTIVFPRRS
jgi:acyl dehydratase